MSTRTEAQGLTADWLNGWLAAIGATVVVPGLRVSWSDDAVPWAIFEWDEDDDVVEAIASALPTATSLDDSVIARTRDGYCDFPRNVALDAYRDRAALERSIHSGHLAASVSDLRGDLKEDDLDHGAFDVPAPHGETLWSRALRCADAVPRTQGLDWVRDALGGQGRRVQLDGLGFDARRLPASVQASVRAARAFADPVIELLCFSAIVLFPTRGNGRRIRQRGWADGELRRGAFTWMAWRPSLDRWAIDAFLDLDDPPAGAVVARYSSVPYTPPGDSRRRAYFGEPLP